MKPIRETDMGIKYFQDTDTLYIKFKPAPVVERRVLDENTQMDLPSFSHEQVVPYSADRSPRRY